MVKPPLQINPKPIACNIKLKKKVDRGFLQLNDGNTLILYVDKKYFLHFRFMLICFNTNGAQLSKKLTMYAESQLGCPF